MKRLLLSHFLLTVCLAGPLRADSVVVFNEIMYHPATNEPGMEWLELRNEMAVDVDLSGWSISGGIQYTFASNTIVRGGGYVVVAIAPSTLMTRIGSTNVLGPFTGRLGNNGDTLRLRNNSGRVVDEVHYGVEGDWPVAPDGSGVSLAKRDRDSASGPAGNWTSSDQVGGTPGAANFPSPNAVPADTRLLAPDAAWKYDASGTDLGTAWRAAGYNDSLWAARAPFTNRSIGRLFNTGVGTNGVVQAAGTLDPHYFITAAAQGTVGTNATVILNHPAWLANDATSSWIGVLNPGANNVNAGVYSYQTTFSLAGFIPRTAQLSISVAVDNDLNNVLINGVPSGLGASGFATFNPPLLLTSGFVAGLNTLEFRTINQDGPGPNPHGFRATLSGTALAVNTNAPLPSGPATFYFRKAFAFSGDPAHTQLRLNPILADGAIVYLNGVEVFRQNMPAGPAAYATPALADVPAPDFSGLVPIAADSLVAGTNVLAVEVHQAAGSTDAPLFGADLIATPVVVPPPPPVTLAFNELSASTNAEFWLELVNYGTNTLPLAGYLIVRDGVTDNEFTFPAGRSIAPDGYLAVTNTDLGFLPVAGDKLFLLPPARDKVIDSVVVKQAARARSPDGTGAWLIPSAPSPGGVNHFTFHHELVINEIMYHHKRLSSTNSLPPMDSSEAWIELYNVSSDTINLTGWEMDGGISYRFTPGKTIAPGGYLVVADDAAALRALYPSVDIVGDLGGHLSHDSDLVRLKDPAGNPAGQVRYLSSGRWPEYADGGGSSLELRDPNADFSKAEAWAASDESGKSSWQTVSYRMVATIPSGSGQPTTWTDFIFGLLSGGECLVDDLSVIESPTTTPVQMLANGDFENGLTGWRALGDHGHSRVEVDPQNPGNHVLHLIATGPQEHMHNHIEASTIGYRPVTSGREYQISYRARWLAGNNLLNTRLYFNRAARTTALPVPARNGTPGAPNSRFAGNLGPTFSGFQHQNVIPRAGEAVAVSVVAQDPQGVASCEVWWSPNGGPWNNAPMTAQAGGLYLGTIPGHAAGTIVQFYVRAVDGLGAAATYPAKGPDSGALYTVADGQANLNLGHNVRIILTPANTDLLHAFTNVMSNDNLPCTVVYDESRAYYDMGVRLKGSERGRYSDTRVSYHLEFPPDDLFRGVHPVMLVDRSGAGDSTANKQQEILIKHILLRAGNIPSPQPDLCRVIAPRALHIGPAIFSPRHEDEFVRTAFDNGGDGTMWELELIYYPTTTNQFGYKNPQPDSVVGTDLADLTNDPEIYRYNFIIKNHRDEDNYGPFIGFAKPLSLSGAQLDQQTRQVMDVDEWMRVWALVTLCGVGDSYTFGNNHNLFMYLRPTDRKMLAFPVDMDFSFNRSATASLVGDQNVSKVINLPGNLRGFYGHILDIIASSYNTNYMAYWVSHYQKFVPGQDYSAVLSYIQQRAAFAITTINNAGGNSPFAISGTNFITTSNNLVILTGTAPVQVKTIQVNGIEYPVTWTSVSGWTLRLPVSSPTNVLNVVGYDLRGNELTNFIRTVTVKYTGPSPDPQGAIVFNEILYNPTSPDGTYVELFNTANVSFDLSGFVVNGLDFTFPPGSIITNRQFLVLARNRPGFAAAYGNVTAFAQFDGNLDPDGETLTLLKPGDSNAPDLVIDKIRYENRAPWSAGAVGSGSSLQLIDASQDNSRVSNWTDHEDWRFANYTGTISGGTTLGTNFLIFMQTPGDVYLDDLILVTGTQAGVGPNLIINGDFESALTGPWTLLGNHSNSVVSTEFSHSGNSSLHLIATGSGGATAAIRQSIPPLETNTVCTLSFWFRPSTNGSVLWMRTTPGSTFLTTNGIRPVLFTPGAPNTVAAPMPAYDPLWLNELQADNLSGPVDNFGQHDPWIELYNAGPVALDLSGYFLANNYDTNLTQWQFPAGSSIPPGEFKLIWADGQPGQSAGADLHASFRLNSSTGSVALVRLLGGKPQITDYLTYSGVGPGFSYGDFPDGQPFHRQGFFHPSPRGTNDNLAPPLVVYINEWMAANSGTLLNTNNSNHYDDWLELYNPGGTPADLAGYFLTDNLTDKFQFPIPAGYVIAPHGFLLVWADSKPSLNSSNDPDLHVNFRLNQGGDEIGLFASDGRQIDAVIFEPQFTDWSQGRFPDGPGTNYFLATPTPRGPNTIWANRYPVLDPIADASLFTGQALSFTARAADPDQPGQRLTFSLDAPAPTGAGIDPASGVFTWTPGPTQGSTTNLFTVRVTDTGTPPLSAARAFTVVVTAGFGVTSTVRHPNGDLTLNIATIVGKTYRVEFKTDLSAPTWTPLGSEHVATSSILPITDNIGTNPQRFYRVVQLD